MLSLAVPGFLGLAALAGLILLLHSQRQRRRVVGSLQLWRQLQIPAGSRRARRRWPPLSTALVLQLAALLALALALAQPFWGRERAPDHLIVVLDASVGMALREEGGRRLDLARAELARTLGARTAMGPKQISLLAAGVRPRLEAARWPWRRGVLGEPLQRLLATDGPADWSGVAEMLPSLLRPDEEAQILFVSHGPVPGALREAAGEMPLTELRIGTPQPHAWVEANLTARDAAAGRWRLSGTVGFEDGLAETTLAVGYADAWAETPLPWAAIQLEADAEGRAFFSQDLDLPGSGLLTLRFPGQTGQEPDAARYVLTDVPAVMQVLYLGDGQQPLLRALQAVDGVEIYQADALPEDAARFALVVIEDVTVPHAPQTNTLWIGRARVDGMEEPAALTEPDPDMWDSRHPLARGIDWSALRIGAAHALPRLTSADVLLESQGLPLIQSRELPQGRAVHLAFDPADSDWPDQTSFALFAAALVDWLGQRPGEVPPPACRVGVPCALDARLAGEWLTPLGEGGPVPVHLTEAGFVPERAGLYRLSVAGAEGLLAVNPSHLPSAADAPPAVAFDLPRGWSVWLLALAAGLLAIEGALAARRKGRLPRMAPLGLGAVALTLAAALDVPLPVPQAREAVMLILPPPLGEDGASTTAAQAGGLTGPRIGMVGSGAPATVLADVGAQDAGLTPPQPGRIVHGAAALALAAAMVPEDRSGRIVLGADMLAAPDGGLELAGRGIVIDHLSAPPPVRGEVVMRGIELPRQLLAGDAVRLIGLVHAQAATPATLSVLQDGAVIAEQDISLDAGNNRIETVLPAIAPGETLIEMHVSAPGDTYAENNRAGRIVTALQTRPIAVLATSEDHGNSFAALLEADGLEAVVLQPQRAPHYLADWLAYGGVVLLNTPAIALTTHQQGLIETAVADHGLGLLILGGNRSFGPGGYFETALERVSPLSSRIPREAPEVAMAFVLDRSGSMQQPVGAGNRLGVAKQATLAAIELLNPQSRVGIIVFDAEAQTILPLDMLDMDRALAALEGVDPGGGTAIYPGLVQAFEMLQGVDAPARHVVVMTDGLSQPGDFPGILADMRAEGITASAVAIGQGSDLSTVEMIAGLGGGSAHASLDFEALPSILSQEAMLLSEPIEEGRSQPQWADTNAAFLRGLPNPMPPVEGFVLTTAKPEARLALVTPDAEGREMPLMAWWRYGNGTVLALSTDATGGWTRAWHGLEQYAGLWGRALRQFQPTTPAPGLHLTTDGDGETLRVTLVALDSEGAPQSGLDLTASVSLPGDEGTLSAPLREELSGLYRGGVTLNRPGRYDVTVAPPDSETELAAAYHHSYPAQFDLAGAGGAAARLAATSGGATRDAADVLAAGVGLSWHWRGVWQSWALLALTLFMAELVRRYVGTVRRRPPPTETEGSHR